jgi:hypothetical protein
MSDSSRFSVNNTLVRRVQFDGKLFIEKTIRCNVSLPISLDEINVCFAAYQDRLRAAGIAMPSVVDSRVDGDCIVCLCEDGGPNLVERYESPEALVRSAPDVVASVARVLKKAMAAGVALDPHIKNFVGQGLDLLYVDFSPPLLESYIDARLSVASGAEERSILQKNFAYFTTDSLPYHFAGDFLNLDPGAEALFPDLHAVLQQEGLVPGVGLKDFTATASSIRALEDLRLRKQIFMI